MHFYFLKIDGLLGIEPAFLYLCNANRMLL